MFENKLQGIGDLAPIAHVGKTVPDYIVEQRCCFKWMHYGCVSDLNKTREPEVFANRIGCSEPFTRYPSELEADGQ